MQYRIYWEAFGNYLMRNSNVLRPPAPRDGNWLQFSTGTSKTMLYAVANVPPRKFRIDLVLERDDAKEIFHHLHGKREEIGVEIGIDLSWEERPSEKYSHVILYQTEELDPSDHRSWEGQFIWLKEMLERFDRVFRGRLSEAISGKESFSTPSFISQEVDRIAVTLEQSGDFDPSNITDARERVLKAMVQRRGQTQFRDALLTAYEGRCCISGCGVKEVLEAAHIIPYLGDDTNHTTNGLLLRSDLHTLFDLGLISVDPKQHTVCMDRRLSETPYWEYANEKINLPNDMQLWPNTLALSRRWNGAGL